MSLYPTLCDRCGTPIWFGGDLAVLWCHNRCPDPHDDRLDRDEGLGDWHDHLATVAEAAERGEHR